MYLTNISKRRFLIAFFTFLCFYIKAQNTADVVRKVNQIKNDSNNYIFSVGEGNSIQSADEQALYGLTSQISLSVESLFESVSQWGKNNNLKEDVKTVVKTYSNTTLNNAERIVLEQTKKKTVVFRYIKRVNVTKVFESRSLKIKEFVILANKYERESKISDALRYYYWAFLLLKSHPNQKSLNFIDFNAKSQLLSTYIPDKLKNVLTNVVFHPTKKYELDNLKVVEGVFTYKKQKVNGISYSYWTGLDWVVPTYSIDDHAILKFTTLPKKIALKIEYIFKNEVQIDDEVEKVIASVKPISFDQSANKSIELNDKHKKNNLDFTNNNVSDNEKLINSYKSIDLGVYKLNEKEIKPYLNKISLVLNAVKTKNYLELKKLSTKQGNDIAVRLLKYGNAQLLNSTKLIAYRINNSIVINSVPMQFSFNTNRSKFIEKVVFRFNENLLLDDLTFATSQRTQQDILQREDWSEENRITIIEFLERYKTAYALKRLDFISSIFSDDALIIVGKVIKVFNNNELNSFKKHSIVKQNRYTKKEFIKHLGYTFKRKEYVKLQFEDVTIRRAGIKKNLYGIQIKQNYYSSNYGDTGYLFLMVDLQKPKKPIIHVRTWQLNKNKDGSIYGIGDF
jgi:hypothetical protein